MVDLKLQLMIMIVGTNMSLYQEYKEKKKEYYNFLNTNKPKILESALLELKKFEGLNKIIITGYTPSFNDGDPCNHWSTAHVSNSMFGELAESGEVGELSTFVGAPDDLDDELSSWFYSDDTPEINPVKIENRNEIDIIISDIENILEDLFDTNFIIYIDLTSDVPTFTKDYYGCGY